MSAEPPPPGPPELDGGPIRVATIPHDDAYVDAVLPPDAVRVGPAGDRSPWLDVAHLEAHAADVDVLHLHSGDGQVAAAAGQCWAETVRRLRLPLVVTVHRLPPSDGGAVEARYDDHLEAVLGTAEVVLTLTPGAADEIADRFGRTAIVVSHPSVLTADPGRGAERGLVGLRLGPPSAGVPDARALVQAALSGAVSGGGRLRVLAEDERWVGRAVRDRAARGELELVVHPPADRPAQLQQVHVAVLPEPCGTYSRDLEVCRDVGTLVVAPTCGWFAEQWSEVVSYATDASGRLDPLSLTGAVSAALTRPMPRPADRGWRAEQRAAVQQVHSAVYRQVAGDRVWA